MITVTILEDINLIKGVFLALIQAGIIIRIIWTLYAAQNDMVAFDSAVKKVKRLIWAMIIAACMSDLMEVFTGNITYGTEIRTLLTSVKQFLIVHMLPTVVGLSAPITLFRLLLKLIEVQKAEEEEKAELEKQAKRMLLQAIFRE